MIAITTADGTAQAHLVAPTGATRAVILYMDAFGPRPALYQMAERIAAWGVAVLVPDLFYRFGAYGPFDAKTAFGVEASRNQLMSMIMGTTQAQTVADTAAFLAALDAAGITGPVATVGYCMGGARALNAAAAYADRVVAAASFHGGNLASDQPGSPHLAASRLKCPVYIGSAAVDGSFPPAQSALLEQALRAAEVDFTMENYQGMVHGWTVPDSAAYNAQGAERHWRRLQSLLSETLLA
jgi:carboxymethylenebutenolidase